MSLFISFFIVFIGLGKSSERSEKKSSGSKCVSIAPDSNFEFLFLFMAVQIAMTYAVNWKTILLNVCGGK